MMFCCLMGLNLEDWRWPVEMGGPKVGITHDGRPPERRGGHHVAMGAIMMCHGHLEGEGHWGEEGVLCYFQVQLLLKCNFVLQLRLASKLTSRRAGTHAIPHKGFNDSLRIGTRSLLRVE